MNIFNFQVADFKRISKMIFGLAMLLIPLILLSFYFIRDYSDLPFIITGLLILIISVAFYLSILKFQLIYNSEFTINHEGIIEKNLKTGKTMFFRWEDIESFKSSEARHTNENKEYIKITFYNTNHTISISEYIHDAKKMAVFNMFKSKITENLKSNQIIKNID